MCGWVGGWVGVGGCDVRSYEVMIYIYNTTLQCMSFVMLFYCTISGCLGMVVISIFMFIQSRSAIKSACIWYSRILQPFLCVGNMML